MFIHAILHLKDVVIYRIISAVSFNTDWFSCVCILFVTSKQILFAFGCDEGETFQVQFHLQEKVIKLRGCPDDELGLCDWFLVKKNHGDISATCNPDFCNSKQHKFPRWAVFYTQSWWVLVKCCSSVLLIVFQVIVCAR